VDYVLAHTERGECQCGKCFDKGTHPDPEGHTVDLGFFKVAAKDNPDKAEFLRLTKEHQGEFGDCNPVDGKDHSYLELGGWIGSQGVAVQYMGLGALLGIFHTLSPAMLGIKPDDPLYQEMLGMGFLSVQAITAEIKVEHHASTV